MILPLVDWILFGVALMELRSSATVGTLALCVMNLIQRVFGSSNVCEATGRDSSTIFTVASSVHSSNFCALNASPHIEMCECLLLSLCLRHVAEQIVVLSMKVLSAQEM